MRVVSYACSGRNKNIFRVFSGKSEKNPDFLTDAAKRYPAIRIIRSEFRSYMSMRTREESTTRALTVLPLLLFFTRM